MCVKSKPCNLWGMTTATNIELSPMDTQPSKYTHLPVEFNQWLFDDCIENWWMTQQERFALICLLDKLRPKCAIEIGTLNGGSLSALSKYSEKVYSIDIDGSCEERLGNNFKNVEFITGDSHTVLSPLLKTLQHENIGPQFALIDGDHSKEGVKKDVNTLLDIIPNEKLIIVLHDSFNPECRSGMLAANWEANPYVHMVELDFIPGRFNCFHGDPSSYRQMTCGLALAVLLPYRRKDSLAITAHEDSVFNILYQNSIHKKSLLKKTLEIYYRLKRRINVK